jgi:hypothetical protein
MNQRQTFVNGIDLKEDLHRLDDLYSVLPPDVRDQGLWTFAKVPPGDASFLVTRLWDTYLPLWRQQKDVPNLDTAEHQKAIVEEINKFADEQNPDIQTHDEQDMDKLDNLTIKRRVWARKGKWRRFSEDQERRMRESQ